MSQIGRRLKEALHLGVRAAWRGVLEFYAGRDLMYAASIAYYSLVSIFPFALLTLTILGRLSTGRGEATLLQVVAVALPGHFDFVMTQIGDLARSPLRLSVFGTIVMTWASMGVFGAITSAVNYAWGVETPHGFLKHKLIAFLMLMGVGLLLVATLVLVSTVQFVQARWFAPVVGVVPGLARMGGLLYRSAPTPLFIMCVGLIYYFVPNTKVRLRDVWVGAILAGVLWRLAFAVFSWYVRDFSRFSVDGSVAAVVAFLVWVYFSAVFFLYGVEVSAAYALLEKSAPAGLRPERYS